MTRLSIVPRFGEQRLHRADVGQAHRALYRLMGVGEPAHYLHHRYLRRALDSLGAGFAPSSILDAGCGSADHSFYLARRYPDARLVGVDINERLIALNRATASVMGLRNVEFRVASVEEPIGETFDLIVSIDVLEHLHRQQRALELLRAALTPIGVAYFHVPTERPRPVPFSRHIQQFHDWAEEEHVADDLTVEEFEAACTRAGFTTTRVWRTFGYWTGEMATSLFAIPFRNTPRNRLAQAILAPFCRALVLLDPILRGDARYAVGLLLRKVAGATDYRRR
jgi:SAM-dependent methyltransferase